MSQQRHASSDVFVPFSPAPPPAAGAPTPPAPAAAAAAAVPPGSPPLRVAPRAEPKLEFTPLEPRSVSHAPGHAASTQPVVTLQRDGDRVTSIRIECPCGQVIDLACRYETNTFAP